MAGVSSCMRAGSVSSDATETTESFSKKRRLKCHICSHTGEKLYKCDTCGEEFVKRRLLKNHTCSQSEEKLYKCDSCGEEFVKRRLLKNHTCSQSKEKLYKCDTCGEEFVKRRLLKNHTCSQSEEKLYKCDTCGEEFVKRRLLKNHACSQSEVKLYKCDTCGEEFEEQFHLNNHICNIGEGTSHECGASGKLFTKRIAFKKHVHTHHIGLKSQVNIQFNENLNKCDIAVAKDDSFCCSATDKSSVSSTSWEQSCELIHNISTDRDRAEECFRCVICEASFPWHDGLKRHVLTHTGEKPFKCDTSGAMFADSSNLVKTHLRIDTGE